MTHSGVTLQLPQVQRHIAYTRMPIDISSLRLARTTTIGAASDGRGTTVAPNIAENDRGHYAQAKIQISRAIITPSDGRGVMGVA